MTLRRRLLFAQVPLAAALVLVGIVSTMGATHLGERSRLILADNYRSVLAAQRMKESLERIDSDAVLVMAGHGDRAAADASAQRAAFENELRVQEGNITEASEAELTTRLRSLWNQYQQALERFHEPAQGRCPRIGRRFYFATLAPSFARVKALTEEILAINQDAMVRKSDRAVERARTLERLVIVAVAASLALGLLASTFLIARTLRPLGVVNAAVRRFSAGDLAARAAVESADEIGAVAVEFNRLAERLELYRASTLGELIQGQQTAQAAIDSLPDPVLMLDAKGAVSGANAAATELLRVDTERPGDESLAGADPGVRALIERLRAHVLGGRGMYVPRGFEDAVRVIAPGPEGERVLLPRATPIYGERGAVAGAAIVLQDATRLFRFDELKNDLVATVAHEFRTPLTSLRMALHLCTEQVVGPLTEKQADLLFAAREDCERLQVIVDDLLNLSRIEAGHVDLQRRRCEPMALVDAAIDVHRPAATQARLVLRREVSPGLPEVFVDADRLQLVFANLLSNAIRYAPPDSEIIVRARRSVDRPTQLRALETPPLVMFEVSDSGPGIPADHQAGLFEKFFRVPGSAEGGSGLGLFIARGLVQAHGGRIGVDSAPGRGSRFWFTVPAATASASPCGVINAASSMPPLKVLFVASEVAPYRKTGGLADVAGALPKALRRRGIDVRVVMPLYAGIKWNDLERLDGLLNVPMYTGAAAGGRAAGDAARQRRAHLLHRVPPLLRPAVPVRSARAGLPRQSGAVHAAVPRVAGAVQGAGVLSRRHPRQRLADGAGAHLRQHRRMGQAAARGGVVVHHSQPGVPGQLRRRRHVHHRPGARALQPRRVRAPR